MNPPRRLLHRYGPLALYLLVFALLWRLGAGRAVWGQIAAVWGFLPFALGLLCGFTLAVGFVTAWIFLAGPLQELLMERLIDPRRRAGEAPTPSLLAPQGMQGVLVSDLHIDTWEYPADGRLSERERRFLSLLDAVRADPSVDSFYLNGDLMDIPLHPDPDAPEPLMLRLSASLSEERGVLLARYDRVLKALLFLSEPDAGQTAIRRAVFQTGNHDVGVSGLRYVRPTPPNFLPPVGAAWNPSLLLQTDADGHEYPRWVYAEHGHHWDPLLWLYMRYALLDILRSGHQRREAALLSGMQRGGQVGLGVQDSVPDAHLPPAPAPGTRLSHFEGDQPGFASELIRLRYRQAARRTFRQFRSQGDGRVKAILIGHTHHPDRYVFPGGQIYLNSGDWSGVTGHCAYCVLDADGGVRGPFQWESAAKAEFGVGGLGTADDANRP